MIDRNRYEEGAERGVATKTSDRAQQREKGVLHQVLGCGLVAPQPAAERSHVGVVRVVSLAQRS